MKAFGVIRETIVYTQSEQLTLADEPIRDDIGGGEIELGELYEGLQTGRWIIVSGERADIQGVNGITVSELAMLAGIKQSFKPGDKYHTTLLLAGQNANGESGLQYKYKRDTVKIYGNVVKATHGETRNEVLGSGDAAQTMQTFALKQPPLTFVSAPTLSGIESTLHIRVNDVEWHETESLAELKPPDRNFITKTDDEAKISVIFGNGERGARLPTGIENITAVYRNGIGKVGNVKAEQISLLLTKPLGVKEVINPLRASGGADKETRDQARRNVPIALSALDRLVSTSDYADFARTFAGIGKTSAVRLSDGYRQIVHLTIVGAEDVPIDVNSDLYHNLRRALKKYGDTYQSLKVVKRELVALVIAAKISILADYLWESVALKIRAALLETFSFERRELGQNVFLSEVVSVIQNVEGVSYSDIDVLGGIYAEQDEPLRALLEVISEQVNFVEADIAQMYDNWFIETCDEWAVPYIGDLLGYKILHNSGEPTDVLTREDQTRERILIPRRDVANVIRYRRRKGILALLELLTRDAADYPAARAVEFYKSLGWTQAVNFRHLKRGRTIDLRDGDGLDLINSPFDKSAHTIDLRRASSHRAQGRCNISGISIFVWRFKSYSVTETPAYCLEEEAPECYTFNALGHDTPLYNCPQTETEPTHIAGELNLPTPIRRRAFEKRLFKNGKVIRSEASENYYDKSLSVFLSDRKGALKQIPREAVIPANLSDWEKYRPPRGFVAVDPKLGRIIFPPDQKPRYGVVVSYQYAFSTDIGGGEYNRPLSQPKDAKIYRVGKGETLLTISSALAAWEKEETKPLSAVIEIQDSGIYTEPLKIELKADEFLQIRAANRRRPIIRLLDYQASLPDALTVKGGNGSRFTLDGLLVVGRSVQIIGPDSTQNGDSEYDSDVNEADEETPETGDLCEVAIRHCTLVPGWSLHCNCEPQRPNEPSLELEFTRAQINIEHSIIGTILVEANERSDETQIIRISDSILDATGENRVALGANEGGLAYVNLTVKRTTVIGKIKTHEINLAENSIFKGVVTVGRRQQGCVRFCYVAPGSRTPRRYKCQPDFVEQTIDAKLRAPSLVEIEAAKTGERMRVEPHFNSLRYGSPTYCQLAEACADEILRGADDESEIGAFHDLYQPQRAANLQARLDEYVPANTEVGIIFAD